MLITVAYIEEQKILHKDPAYGAGSHRYVHLLANIIKREGCKTVLDYGAGKGTLAAEMLKIGIKVDEYDPCVPGKENGRFPADLVTCIDVMEHIEPQCIDHVIFDLRRMTLKCLFLDIATKFDKHRWLTDGRNSHQVVEDDEWWKRQFIAHDFMVKQTWTTGLKAWIALLVPA